MLTVFSPLLNEPLGLFNTLDEAESWVANEWSEDDAVIQEADTTEVSGYRLERYGL